MMRRIALCAALLTCSAFAYSYPLDQGAGSGIRRLAGYQAAQQAEKGPKLPKGALLAGQDISLSLSSYAGPDFDAVPADAVLQGALEGALKQRDPSYAVVLVDYSDPSTIRWAGIQPDLRNNAGSVGKLLCMIGLFDSLARAFPALEDRARILREVELKAGDWVIGDHHQVPRFDPETGTNSFAVLKPDDVFRLSEWIDHAISVSANGAGSVIWREAMLLRHFGRRYPQTWQQSEAFFATTPKSELSHLALQVVEEPLRQARIDTDSIKQGSFWTKYGKQQVPGTQSYASPRELARISFRLEQGRLVDSWSSLEMKKYLYMTKRRYRYVYAPELHSAAVFFKSGSLYQCVPEEGFRCGKYMGNKQNMMNSVTLIEAPAGAVDARRYLVSLMSNVLRFNSAWDHARIGAAIDEIVRTRKTTAIADQGSAGQMLDAGRSD